MRKNKYSLQIIFSIMILTILISDTKTAANGVKEGIDTCLKVIIPSLFPFFIVTTYLNSMIIGCRLPKIQRFTKQLHIPVGGEFILLLGLTGGYPVGAKLISDLYSKNKINWQTAHILLGYCNNAGPAFIFGIAGTAFTSPFVPVVLWIIHILSAIGTGFLLPKPELTEISVTAESRTSLAQAMKSSISACTSVCSWVIIFKILLSYLHIWFKSLLLRPVGIILTGILELSNGCIAATQIANPLLRFILITVFLAFGGLCVLFQTTSVTGTLGIGLYMHGKLIQTCISFVLAYFCGIMLFPGQNSFPFPVFILLSLLAIVIIFTAKRAKNGGNQIHNHV